MAIANEDLINAATEAREHAFSKYSGYSVGAAIVDEAERTITCPTSTPRLMNLTIKDDRIVKITGNGAGGEELEIRVRRVRREDFLLVNRGFRWINEIPFNR